MVRQTLVLIHQVPQKLFFSFFAALKAVCHVDRQLAHISSVWSPDCIVKFISPLDVCSRDSLFFSSQQNRKYKFWLILIKVKRTEKFSALLSGADLNYPEGHFGLLIYFQQWRFDSTMCILIEANMYHSCFQPSRSGEAESNCVRGEWAEQHCLSGPDFGAWPWKVQTGSCSGSGQPEGNLHLWVFLSFQHVDQLF